MDPLEEYEDLMNLMAMNNVRQRRKRVDPFAEYDSEEFIQRYRLSKDNVQYVCSLIEDAIKPLQRRKDCNLSTEQKLLITLRYLATGNYQRVDGDLMGVSQSSVSRIIHQVIQEIAKKSSRFIHFPNYEERVELKDRNFMRYGLPSVIGAIDGTQIPIKSPGGENAEVFRNRKGFFSINVQAVVDADGCFTNVVCRWPGSTHDSTIFNNSRLCADFEAGNINGMLLGDNGYQCRRYLLTPFLNPATVSQRQFNKAHRRCRGTVERAFGQLKQRFRCLTNGIRLRLDIAQDTIVACFCLHNLAKKSSVPSTLDDEYVLEQDNDNNENDNGSFIDSHTHGGMAMRNSIVAQFF